ncbi:MAG TPA: MMPL family transporter, partial [Polyangia bacterium]
MPDLPPATKVPRARSRAFVQFTLRWRRWLWATALLLAIPATFATARLYARLSSEFEELLPRDAPSVRAIGELRARMPGLQYLGVVVDAGNSENLPAAERFIGDLADRIKAYPADLVRAVKTGAEEERRFIEKNAALYADLGDLTAIRDRIAARRRWELSNAMGGSLTDEPAPSLDFSDINQKYEARTKGVGHLAGGRFTSASPPTTLLLVEVAGFSTGADTAEQLLGRVRDDIAALGGIDKYAPGMRLGFAADVAVSAEEMAALAEDLTLASLLVVAAVVLAMLLYFRWWRCIPALFIPLFLATVYAFAASTLPPLRVDRLNSNTAFLGSIIIGNGINFAILFLARYVEARRRGETVEDSLTEAVWGSRMGTLVAALAAGIAYGSLLVTQFRGFRQFGAIGGIGMVLCWLVTFLLTPSLIAFLDRGPHTAPKPLRLGGQFLRPFAKLVTRRARAIAIGAVVVTLAAAAALPVIDASLLESDFSRLRRRDTWEVGEGFWGRKMDRVLGRYLSPTVLLADSEAAATKLTERLQDAVKVPPLRDLISEIRGPDNVLPSHQPEKIAMIAAIKRQLTEATRAAADPVALDKFDRLIERTPAAPIDLTALPATFTIGLRERDGSFGKSVLVFPSLSKANWRNENLAAFTAELRRIADDVARELGTGERPARVAGALPLSADIVESITRDGPLASSLAFSGVMVLVLLMFQFRRPGFYVLGALLTGVLWLLAAVHVFGIRINFVNFIAFPITFGIGVDYAVNVMSRYVQDGSRDIEGPIVSTGAAVGLCSLTTIIGYSSLLLASNQGLFLFGLVAVLGEIACLVTALAVLPAFLILARKTPGTKLQQPEAPG